MKPTSTPLLLSSWRRRIENLKVTPLTLKDKPTHSFRVELESSTGVLTSQIVAVGAGVRVMGVGVGVMGAGVEVTVVPV
jgi:hypothetical protein